MYATLALLFTVCVVLYKWVCHVLMSTYLMSTLCYLMIYNILVQTLVQIMSFLIVCHTDDTVVWLMATLGHGRGGGGGWVFDSYPVCNDVFYFNKCKRSCTF